jgi:hypothetical protein
MTPEKLRVGENRVKKCPTGQCGCSMSRQRFSSPPPAYCLVVEGQHNMPTSTTSEQYFKQWCRLHGIECRSIKKARAEGHKRPDFAIKVHEHWCIVEIKQIDPNPQDRNQLERASEKNEAVSVWWKVGPGSRLIRGIRNAEHQLCKFSMRGLPTVVCFFDNTLGFYDKPRDVEQVMARVKTNIISAIAVLREPTNLVVDLFHYPGARVPIPPDSAARLVRKNIMPVTAK